MTGSGVLVIGAVLLMPVMAYLTLREEHILHAIIGRGMLGIAAAIAYALMGSPDVAVTEALMGAFLVTLLYVVVFSSGDEFRVGYLEIPQLVTREGKNLEGYAVELLSLFGKEIKVKPNFVPFENREALLEAVREGYMDMALGPFIFPADSSDNYLTLPFLETRIYRNSRGEWMDLLRIMYTQEGRIFDRSSAEVEKGFYSVLMSEDAHDLKDMLFSYMGDEENLDVVELKTKYFGEER
jgi:putative multicomponent Na+:H+ antiporter subunit B